MKLTFRIFADDTNMLYTSKDSKELESVVNAKTWKGLKIMRSKYAVH